MCRRVCLAQLFWWAKLPGCHWQACYRLSGQAVVIATQLTLLLLAGLRISSLSTWSVCLFQVWLYPILHLVKSTIKWKNNTLPPLLSLKALRLPQVKPRTALIHIPLQSETILQHSFLPRQPWRLLSERCLGCLDCYAISYIWLQVCRKTLGAARCQPPWSCDPAGPWLTQGLHPAPTAEANVTCNSMQRCCIQCTYQKRELTCLPFNSKAWYTGCLVDILSFKARSYILLHDRQEQE